MCNIGLNFTNHVCFRVQLYFNHIGLKTWVQMLSEILSFKNTAGLVKKNSSESFSVRYSHPVLCQDRCSITV